MFGLIAAGVLGTSQPTAYELADGPQVLAELEARATIGKLALTPDPPGLPECPRCETHVHHSGFPAAGSVRRP